MPFGEARHRLDGAQHALGWILDVLDHTHTAAEQAVGRDLSAAAHQLRPGEPHVRDLAATGTLLSGNFNAAVMALRTVEGKTPLLKEIANGLDSTLRQRDWGIAAMLNLATIVGIVIDEAESKDVTEARASIAALKAWRDVPRPAAPTLDDLSRGALICTGWRRA